MKLAERIEEGAFAGGRWQALAAPVDGIVAFAGSFGAAPDFAGGEETLQDLAVSLLDKGTRRRDRFEIASALDRLGANVQFYADGDRIGFQGRCLKQDLGLLLGLTAEQLAEPAFDAAEVEKARDRMTAAVRRSMDSTASRASGALARSLFAPSHPNYSHAPAAKLALLAAADRDRAAAYYAAQYARAGDLLVAVAGDLGGVDVAGLLGEVFARPEAPAAAPNVALRTGSGPAARLLEHMPGKDSLDVRFGHAVPLLRTDAAFIPLMLGVFVLGGNFSARLMATIRDEMGLTYGIGSSLAGFTPDASGYWQVYVTLSRENLVRGIEAVRREVRRFVEGGAGAEELARAQTTITGSYKTALATTLGLATALLTNAERRYPKEYIDRFPEIVQACTLPEVNAAISALLSADRLHEAVAGRLDADALERLGSPG